ncbi:hypothetical protein [Galactobacter sp.]|nr:hypothetical protein [Galactobacter sp.]
MNTQRTLRTDLARVANWFGNRAWPLGVLVLAAFILIGTIEVAA